MGWLGRIAAGIGRAVAEAGAAIANLGRAVVRVVHEVGQWVADAAGRVVRAVGRGLEAAGHRLQGKRSPEVERLEILAKGVLAQAGALVRASAIDDFASYARVKVLEAVLPHLIARLGETQRADRIDRDARIVIEEGQALLHDPASVSDAALEALERLSESLLGRTFDLEALAHLVDLFAGARGVASKALRDARADQRRDDVALRAEEEMAAIGRPGPETAAQIRARIADRAAEIRRRVARNADLELVALSGQALLGAATDRSVRLLFPDQIATIERIVYQLYRAGEAATLGDAEREELRDAVAVFLVDVAV